MDRASIAVMFDHIARTGTAVILALGLLATGCGSSSKQHPGGGGAAATGAEAKSAATGDIPDNQHFLSYSSAKGRWSMVYPEGWAIQGSGADVRFVNKNNVVHVVIARGGSPTAASVAAGLAAARAKQTGLRAQAPVAFKVHGAPAIKVSYTTSAAPDPVTGKRAQLIVDRYVLANGGRVATADLGTQKGVDNVDAYRKMIQSFRWR